MTICLRLFRHCTKNSRAKISYTSYSLMACNITWQYSWWLCEVECDTRLMCNGCIATCRLASSSNKSIWRAQYSCCLLLSRTALLVLHKLAIGKFYASLDSSSDSSSDCVIYLGLLLWFKRKLRHLFRTCIIFIISICSSSSSISRDTEWSSIHHYHQLVPRCRPIRYALISHFYYK